jgi:hypothetical protein
MRVLRQLVDLVPARKYVNCVPFTAIQRALGSSLGMTCRPVDKRPLLGVTLLSCRHMYFNAPNGGPVLGSWSGKAAKDDPDAPTPPAALDYSLAKP